MEFKQPGKAGGKKPESILQEKIRDHLRGKGFFVQNIHGNKFQSGLPDLYCHCTKYPHRWVEIKTPDRAREFNGGLSPRQMAVFGEMASYGIEIWVLTSVHDWTLLIHPQGNWRKYALGGHKIVPLTGFKDHGKIPGK